MLNGLCVPEEEAKIPAVTSGLYYGAGCFETFLAENGRIFKFHEHIERLNRGLGYLGVSDDNFIDADKIPGQIKTLLAKNNLSEKPARIRIQVSLADKSGYSIKENPSLVVIISSQLADKKSNSKKLILSEKSVVPTSARPSDLKLSNMLHYRQAFREAEEKGADDSVMLSSNGFVAETSIANMFWMKDEKIFTPSVDCDILPGIMRNSIIEILKQKMNYSVKEDRFSMDELLKADIVWLTNSVVGFAPVSGIENISFRIESEFYQDLKKQLRTYKEENSIYV
jgi:branched-subunit amino acid aminotransferase/4-amino-4-deoxychorismate lyase